MVLECVGAVLMRWEPREPQKAAVEKRRSAQLVLVDDDEAG